ncbi:MAG: hypothetical protein O7G85_09555 [Planctomycetota bacterium]|nr:hypothetical protein [Planctomycetota bacterium]
MIKSASCLLSIWSVLLISSALHADDVVLRGSSIVLEGCQVLSIKGGQVVFTLPGGRRLQHHFEAVGAIVFEGIEELDLAEQSMLEERFTRAVKWYVLALAGAENDLQRQWIHARLAMAHNAQRQFIQAAGHASAVFTLDDHPVWKSLAPIGHPGGRNQEPYPVVKEAFDHVQAARRVVKSGELVRVVEDLTRQIKPVRDALAKQWKGPRIRTGSTISGYALADSDNLRASLLEAQHEVVGVVHGLANESHAPIKKVDDRPQVNEQPSSSGLMGGGGAPGGNVSELVRNDIESLLNEGEFRLALSQCTRRLAKAGGNDAARLWLWKGQAQLGLSQNDDAAVSFTRGALLYPDSPSSDACLLETARIYQDVYRNPSRARRLLELAIKRAEARGDDIIASRARAMLDP